MPSVKKWFEQKRERNYVLAGFEANENSLDVARQTLRAMEKELYRLERPPLDDISEGRRIVSDSTAEILASKYCWFLEVLNGAKQYADRLQDIANYFSRDKKLQLLNLSFHRHLESLQRDYSAIEKEHEIRLPV